MKPRHHRLGPTELLARMPKALRPRMTERDRVKLGLLHVQTLDAIAKGQANSQILWDWIETTLTWVKVAELLRVGVPEMLQQFDLVIRVTERFLDTGRVLFSGPDYQLAKDGVQVMDELAKETDLANFALAGAWADRKAAALKAVSDPTFLRRAAA